MDDTSTRTTLCGFCHKGSYRWDDGHRSECPYCGGTGLAPQGPDDSSTTREDPHA